MNSKNDYIREYLGVDKFHAKGYTGKRVHALTGERQDEWMTQHSQQTAAVFREIAPDAKLSYAPFPGAGNVVEKFHELRGDACVMFVSLSTQSGGDKEIADGAIPDDLFVCVAAGNFGEDYANGMMKPASAYGVGAVDVRWSAMRGGKPLPGASLLVQSAQYTSHSDHVDFGASTGLYLDGFADTFTGTSCAAPVLAGAAALVNDFFMDKTGRPLPHLSMYRFFKDCAVDIEEKGKDVKVGWGIPRLPDPDTIDIWKYQVPEEDRAAEEADKPAAGASPRPTDREEPKEDKTMKVLIIAGHGAGDNGAVATHGGKTYRECDETRKLAAMLVTEFAKAGVTADGYNLMRNAFADYKEGSLVSRARFQNYDAVLELHFNAFDGKAGGTEAYLTTASGNDETAEAVCKAVAALGFRNRGVKRKNFAVIGQAGVQGAEALLLEVCFLDSSADMALYEKSREAVAEAVVRGFCEAHGIKKAAEKTARQIVQEKAGLEDNTMDYLAAYTWGKELIEKLAKAMQ